MYCYQAKNRFFLKIYAKRKERKTFKNIRHYKSKSYVAKRMQLGNGRNDFWRSILWILIRVHPYITSTKDWMGLENDQFCWFSVLWYFEPIVGQKKSKIICIACNSWKNSSYSRKLLTATNFDNVATLSSKLSKLQVQLNIVVCYIFEIPCYFCNANFGNYAFTHCFLRTLCFNWREDPTKEVGHLKDEKLFLQFSCKKVCLWK